MRFQKTRRVLALGLVLSMQATTAMGQSDRGQMGVGAGAAVTSDNPLRLLTMKPNGSYFNCGSGAGCTIKIPTQTNQQMLDYLKDAAKTTLDRYTQLIRNTETDLNSLLRIVTTGEDSLMALAYKPDLGGRTVDADQVYAAYTRFLEARELIRNDFEINSQFFRNQIDGVAIADPDAVTKEMPVIMRSQIDLLQSGFENRLKVISNLVCNLKFNLLLVETQEPIMQEKIFACDDAGNVSISIKRKGVMLTQVEREELVRKINDLRRPTDKVINTVKVMDQNVRALVDAFVESWGQAQSRRLSDVVDGTLRDWGILPKRVVKGNEDRFVRRKEDFDKLVDLMWFRSALRATFGLPIGTFAIQPFPREAFQRDLFTTTTDMLKLDPSDMFVEFPQFTLAQGMNNGGRPKEKDNFDAVAVRLNVLYGDALNVLESKATNFTGGDLSRIVDPTKGADVLKKDYGMIDLANAFYEEVVKGKSQEWKMLYFAIKLLAADFHEEAMIRTLGGMQKVRAMYRARYIDIPDDERARFKPLIANFQQMISLKAASSGGAYNDVWFNMNVTDGNGDAVSTDIRSVYGELVNNLKDWTANISQARVINVQLEIARRATGDDQSQENAAMWRRALEL